MSDLICQVCQNNKARFQCSGCHNSYYCSVACQTLHWERGDHFKYCQKSIATAGAVPPTSIIPPLKVGEHVSPLTVTDLLLRLKEEPDLSLRFNSKKNMLELGHFTTKKKHAIDTRIGDRTKLYDQEEDDDDDNGEDEMEVELERRGTKRPAEETPSLERPIKRARITQLPNTILHDLFVMDSGSYDHLFLVLCRFTNVFDVDALFEAVPNGRQVAMQIFGWVPPSRFVEGGVTHKRLMFTRAMFASVPRLAGEKQSNPVSVIDEETPKTKWFEDVWADYEKMAPQVASREEGARWARRNSTRWHLLPCFVSTEVWLETLAVWRHFFVEYATHGVYKKILVGIGVYAASLRERFMHYKGNAPMSYFDRLYLLLGLITRYVRFPSDWKWRIKEGSVFENRTQTRFAIKPNQLDESIRSMKDDDDVNVSHSHLDFCIWQLARLRRLAGIVLVLNWVPRYQPRRPPRNGSSSENSDNDDEEEEEDEDEDTEDYDEDTRYIILDPDTMTLIFNECVKGGVKLLNEVFAFVKQRVRMPEILSPNHTRDIYPYLVPTAKFDTPWSNDIYRAVMKMYADYEVSNYLTSFMLERALVEHPNDLPAVREIWNVILESIRDDDSVYLSEDLVDTLLDCYFNPPHSVLKTRPVAVLPINREFAAAFVREVLKDPVYKHLHRPLAMSGPFTYITRALERIRKALETNSNAPTAVDKQLDEYLWKIYEFLAHLNAIDWRDASEFLLSAVQLQDFALIDALAMYSLKHTGRVSTYVNWNYDNGKPLILLIQKGKEVLDHFLQWLEKYPFDINLSPTGFNAAIQIALQLNNENLIEKIMIPFKEARVKPVYDEKTGMMLRSGLKIHQAAAEHLNMWLIRLS